MTENAPAPTPQQMLGLLQERFAKEGFPLEQFIANGEESIERDGIGLSVPLEAGPNGAGVNAAVKQGEDARVLIWKYDGLGPFVMKLTDVTRTLESPESDQTSSYGS